MIHSSLPSFTVFFLCVSICLVSGFGPSFWLLPGPRNLRWFTLTIALGLGSILLLTANLNYLGVPVRFGAPLAIALMVLLAVFAYRRSGVRPAEFSAQDWYRLGACLGGVALFAAPFAFTGAFPFFGDSYSNCAVADFVRENSYHASPEPIQEQLWRTQMWSFAMGHIRMGLPYLLSIVSALLGVKAYWAYVGVCWFILLFCSLSFSVLAADLLGDNLVSLLAVGAFSFNLMMVHWSAAQGFVPQMIGVGLGCLLIWAGFQVGYGEVRMNWIMGLLIAMEICFYPDILPFVLAPLTAAIALGARRMKRAQWMSLTKSWLAVIGVVLLVNGYNVYYAALGYISTFRGRPMNAVGLGLVNYLTMTFGLSSVLGHSQAFSSAMIVLSVILAGVFFLGWSRLKGRAALLNSMVMLICGPIGIWMWISGSEYSVYKVILYLFYLVPLCTATGFGWMWTQVRPIRMTGVALGMAWVAASGYVYAGFARSAYGVREFPTYRTGRGNPSEYMKDFTSLEGLEQMAAARGKTLLLLPDTLPATWASYFFRAPSYAYFIGIYSQMLADRPAPPADSIGLILTERNNGGGLSGKLPIFENNRYALLEAQPVVTLGDDGWYQTEFVEGQPVHWMKDDASLLAFSPKSAMVTLEAATILGPHGKPRVIDVVVNGQPAGQFTVPAGKGKALTPPLNLRSGFTRIELHSPAKTPQIGEDSRILNILFGKWSISGSSIPATTSSTPSGTLEMSVTGATADHWVTPSGVTLVPATRTPYRRIRMEVELPGVAGLLPLEVNATGENGTNQVWSISKPGRYEVVFELSRPATGPLLLLPRRHFVPNEIGANSDKRKLSFRILGISATI